MNAAQNMNPFPCLLPKKIKYSADVEGQQINSQLILPACGTYELMLPTCRYPQNMVYYFYTNEFIFSWP